MLDIAREEEAGETAAHGKLGFADRDVRRAVVYEHELNRTLQARPERPRRRIRDRAHRHSRLVQGGIQR
jgi:hypothetical protein